ncbi:HXXXD-type acyl-transferase family protein [Tanacetum coccineum]
MDLITEEPPQEELGSIRCLGTLREILAKTKTKDQGLLFMEMIVNDKQTLGLINTGATHNFLDVKEVERLGVKCTLKVGNIKSVKNQNKLLGQRRFPMSTTKTLVIHDNGVSQVMALKRQSEIQPLLSAT